VEVGDALDRYEQVVQRLRIDKLGDGDLLALPNNVGNIPGVKRHVVCECEHCDSAAAMG